MGRLHFAVTIFYIAKEAGNLSLKIKCVDNRFASGCEVMISNINRKHVWQDLGLRFKADIRKSPSVKSHIENKIFSLTNQTFQCACYFFIIFLTHHSDLLLYKVSPMPLRNHSFQNKSLQDHLNNRWK